MTRPDIQTLRSAVEELAHAALACPGSTEHREALEVAWREYEEAQGRETRKPLMIQLQNPPVKVRAQEYELVMDAIENAIEACASQSDLPPGAWSVNYAEIVGRLLAPSTGGKEAQGRTQTPAGAANGGDPDPIPSEETSGRENASGALTLNEYQSAAARTINRHLTDAQKLAHAVSMIAAEAGEIAGIHQKTFQGHILWTGKIHEEAGDLLWALAYLLTTLSIPLEEIAAANIRKLKLRYSGDGFTAAESIARVDTRGEA
jgi:NTP pyrophosphatase (non-canonical NTP hydrolase)